MIYDFPTAWLSFIVITRITFWRQKPARSITTTRVRPLSFLFSRLLPSYPAIVSYRHATTSSFIHFLLLSAASSAVIRQWFSFQSATRVESQTLRKSNWLSSLSDLPLLKFMVNWSKTAKILIFFRPFFFLVNIWAERAVRGVPAPEETKSLSLCTLLTAFCCCWSSFRGPLIRCRSRACGGIAFR